MNSDELVESRSQFPRLYIEECWPAAVNEVKHSCQRSLTILHMLREILH